MLVRLVDGALLLRFGHRFGDREAQQLWEAARSSAPLSQLTLDFTDVREFQESACGLLASALAATGAPKVLVRGLTLYRAEVLRRRLAGVRGPHGSTQPCSPALIPPS